MLEEAECVSFTWFLYRVQQFNRSSKPKMGAIVQM